MAVFVFCDKLVPRIPLPMNDLSKYGLDEQSRTTETVTYTNNKKEKTVTLYFGKEDGNGNRYVMLSDSKIVYLVENEKCKNMLNQDTES